MIVVGRHNNFQETLHSILKYDISKRYYQILHLIYTLPDQLYTPNNKTDGSLILLIKPLKDKNIWLDLYIFSSVGLLLNVAPGLFKVRYFGNWGFFFLVAFVLSALAKCILYNSTILVQSASTISPSTRGIKSSLNLLKKKIHCPIAHNSDKNMLSI